MPPRLLPCAFLLSLGVISTIASLQDLRYYQDLIPEPSSEDIALKHLQARLLKAHNQDAAYGALHYAHLQESPGSIKKRLELERAKDLKEHRQILDNLAEKSSIMHHVLSKRRQKHFSNYPPWPGNGHEENEVLQARIYAPRRDPKEIFPYPSSSTHIRRYPAGYNGAFTGLSKPFQNPDPQTSAYRRHHLETLEHGMKEETDFGGRYMSLEQHPNSDIHITGREQTDPDFTYKLEKPSNQRAGNIFGVGPNDPRYYQDTPYPALVTDEERMERILPNHKDTESSLGGLATIPESYQEHELTKTDDNHYDDTDAKQDAKKDDAHEEHQGADTQGPLVMAVDSWKRDEIYFVASLAVCSAAAMFGLVLIIRMLCRLQRSLKAAADVEYPAYGVTGPNKDMSPSGDRRLAQSAQMYHYQHQKQQIIAMESRTATARDPGSVSEAESDEENEEGDYTVYECPGLAPTGEMEVKNPLFHDDPTPATPAAGPGQSKRSGEDHM